MTLLKHLWSSERARHALIAAVLATLLGVVGAFAPLDGLVRAGQALTAPRPASGSIVFIGATNDLSDPGDARARPELATLIDDLAEAGARKIFLNVIFDRESAPERDEALRNAIVRSGRTVLVQRYVTTVAGERAKTTIPQIAGSAPQAISKAWVDPFGFTWSAPYSVHIGGKELQSLPAAITEKSGPAGAEFPIDYSIDYASIPAFTIGEAMDWLASDTRGEMFGGKTIVIGNGGENSDVYASIPGHLRVPASMVAILAAETLKAGTPFAIGWLPPLAVLTAVLLLVILASRRAGHRHAGYAITAGLLPVFFFAFAYLRVSADLIVAVAFLATFATLRLWHLRQRRASLVDELSGLPSFRKLDHDLAGRGPTGQPAVIVAKVHRFDEVLSSLPNEDHGDYVRLIADRFRITDEDLVVYSNGGRYLAWIQDVEDVEQLEAHLNGLRAVFAHPLHVKGTAVDVGITFGADATGERNAARKIAAAASAAERATEAHAPVLLAHESSETDRQWNISLQAKIDEALKSGAIYVVYQPQFDLSTGAMMGAEALVRWNDPDRGQISPSYFVEQCEQTGRMDALTRKVFAEAIGSVSASPLSGAPFQLSMNVSATLLHDFRVVEMLKEALSSASLPASRLTLEITETSRIADYDTARMVMHHLSELGVRLSVDDFGVGAASLETLLHLPFDELKIDRMFVSRIRDNAKARSIVEALVRLSRDLNLVSVAEGVEDTETLKILKEAGCDAAQGYVLGRPADLTLLIANYPEIEPTATAG